jgi:hypothetical protein
MVSVYLRYGVFSVGLHSICHVQHISSLQGTSLSNVGCRSNFPRVPTESVIILYTPLKDLVLIVCDSSLTTLSGVKTSAQTASGILD